MKVSVVFTMKGCPHCTTIKEELNKQNIPFIDQQSFNMAKIKPRYAHFRKFYNIFNP